MKLIRLISAVLFAIFIAGCTEKETQVEVSSVSLNTATIEMVEGETFNLVAIVLPKDAEYDGVIWASSNASVASVNSGTVTAIKEGTATITASAGGKSTTCTVKVSAKIIAVTSVSLDKTSLSMQVGETETITATVKPDDATDKAVVWTSSDDAVASVSNGKITAHKSGKATITAKSGTCSAECVVTVSVNTESITIDKTTLSLAVGESATLTATVKPDDATDKTVAWSSSDESVAKVDDGKVTALKSGKATITAECDGKTAECAVTVTVPTGSVTLDKTTLSLAVGETAQLTATVKPDNATDKNVTWSSSDESVAKVDNGKVTALKSGKATVTAKCGGKTAECTVTVTVPVSSVTLDKTTLSLAVGESTTLTATVKPDDATDKTVAWSSSDESVAKVADGKVTAVKSGKATVTAKCGGKAAECVVTVTVPVSSVTLDKTTLSLAVGESATLTATVKPDDATNKTVTWSSSDESVAKVDNCKVIAINAGQAKITAVVGNVTTSCDVVVYQSDNVIIYTTTDKKVLKPYIEDAFGSAIVSNTYVGDVGIITFEKPLTFIGNMAFYQQSKLQSIVIPNTVSTIGKKSFESCTGLLSVKLPQSLTSIGDYAFAYCKTITSLVIPDNVQKIGDMSFSSCSKAFNNNTLVLPKKLQTISSYAFEHCKLRNIIWNEDLNYIGGWTFGDNDFEEISIPGCLKSSGFLSFSSCKLLKKVELQEGVMTVGQWCFNGCEKLSKVILPSTITQLIDPFDGCYLLKDVYVKAIVPPVLDSYQFRDANLNQLTIWVPRESVDAYKNSGWCRYKDNIKAYDF